MAIWVWGKEVETKRMHLVRLALANLAVYLSPFKICENRWPGMTSADRFEPMDEILLSELMMYHETYKSQLLPKKILHSSYITC